MPRAAGRRLRRFFFPSYKLTSFGAVTWLQFFSVVVSATLQVKMDSNTFTAESAEMAQSAASQGTSRLNSVK
jgi:hypothetical protein